MDEPNVVNIDIANSGSEELQAEMELLQPGDPFRITIEGTFSGIENGMFRGLVETVVLPDVPTLGAEEDLETDPVMQAMMAEEGPMEEVIVADEETPIGAILEEMV